MKLAKIDFQSPVPLLGVGRNNKSKLKFPKGPVPRVKRIPRTTTRYWYGILYLATGKVLYRRDDEAARTPARSTFSR